MVLAAQPLYVLGLMALDAVAPVERRVARIAAAFKSGELDPEQRFAAPYNVGGDWDAECVGLSLGLEPQSNPLRNAIAAARPLVTSPTVCGALLVALDQTRDDVVWLPYSRYWHGYRVVVAPLIAWLSLANARYVVLLMLVGALTYFAIQSKKLIGREATLALLVPTVVMTDFWHMWILTHEGVSAIAIIAGAGYFAHRLRSSAPIGVLIVVAAALGSIYNYLSFSTNPPWQPMLLAFLFLAAARRDDSVRPLLGCVLILAAWAGGYSLTWLAKWILAAATAPDTLAALRDIADVARFRIDGSYLNVVDHRLLAPSVKVLTFVFWKTWQVPWAAALVLLIPALLPWHDISYRRFALLATPAIIPFLWFELLSNHTQIHVHIVYRPVATSLGILLAAWILAVRLNPTDRGS